MKLSDFLELDEMEQAETLWDKGVHIGERDDAVYRYILYQVDGFYVEACYHKEYNVLRQLHVFDDTEGLEPYLKNTHN